MQTEHLPKLCKLDPPKQLHKNVSWIIVTRYVQDQYQALFDMVLDPVVGPMDMLHGQLVLWVFGHLYHGFVIDQQLRCMQDIVAKFLQKVPHPHDLTTNL